MSKEKLEVINNNNDAEISLAKYESFTPQERKEFIKGIKIKPLISKSNDKQNVAIDLYNAEVFWKDLVALYFPDPKNKNVKINYRKKFINFYKYFENNPKGAFVKRDTLVMGHYATYWSPYSEKSLIWQDLHLMAAACKNSEETYEHLTREPHTNNKAELLFGILCHMDELSLNKYINRIRFSSHLFDKILPNQNDQIPNYIKLVQRLMSEDALSFEQAKFRAMINFNPILVTIMSFLLASKNIMLNLNIEHGFPVEIIMHILTFITNTSIKDTEEMVEKCQDHIRTNFFTKTLTDEQAKAEETNLNTVDNNYSFTSEIKRGIKKTGKFIYDNPQATLLFGIGLTMFGKQLYDNITEVSNISPGECLQKQLFN